MSRSKFCVAVSVLASIASQGAKADPQQDPKSVDILGFHIGMPADQIAEAANKAIGNPVLAPRTGTLSMGTFTSSQLLFSELITHHYDPRKGQTMAEAEKVTLTFGLQPGAGVLAIERTTPYDMQTAPTVKDLIASLEEKYGKPTAIEENAGNMPGWYEIVYSYDAAIAYNKPFRNFSPLDCTFSMPGSANGLSDLLASGTLSPTAPDLLPKCGTIMMFKIIPQGPNPALVQQLHARLADLKGLAESNLYMIDLLKKGQQSSAAADQQKASANKPKL